MKSEVRPQAGRQPEGHAGPESFEQAVERRLERLRALYVPMTRDEAARQMVPPPPNAEPFEEQVFRRLEELRALMDLTQHLHRVTDRAPTPRVS